MNTDEALSFFIESKFEVGLKVKHGNADLFFYGELFLSIKDGCFDLVKDGKTIATFSENAVEYRNFVFELRDEKC